MKLARGPPVRFGLVCRDNWPARRVFNFGNAPSPRVSSLMAGCSSLQRGEGRWMAAVVYKIKRFQPTISQLIANFGGLFGGHGF